MNKELLLSIKALDNKVVQDFLLKTEPKDTPNNASKFGAIKIKGLKEPDIRTLAAGFRQILLSEIPGWAITRMKTEYRRKKEGSDNGLLPILHKYYYIPGVVENIRDIIGNLQKGIFRLREEDKALPLICEFFCNEPVSSHYKEFLLGEFFDEDQADMVVNPEHTILTFQDTGFFVSMEITIEKGVGFKSAEETERDEIAESRQSADVLSLALDADFNPVKKVACEIKGELLRYDIETNGAVSPFGAYRTGYDIFKTAVYENYEVSL